MRIGWLWLLAAIMIAPDARSWEKQIVRKHYNSWEQEVGYSQVVRAGDTLYISGITADGETLAKQLDGIYSQLSKILSDFKVDSNSVIKETIHSTDLEQLQQAIPIRLNYYPDKRYPASTWVQVERLFLPQFLVEIEFVVNLPTGQHK